MSLSPANKVALVTGASRGIGEALVKELIARDWMVVGVARSEDKLEELSQELGKDRFYPVVCDVSNKQTVKNVSKRILEEGLVPTLFFLNAGIAGEIALESPHDFRVSKHEEIFDTNYFGVLYWVEAWLPVCQKMQGATFVVTSSLNAIFAPPVGSAYAASKAAIAKTFEALSLGYHHSVLNFLVVYPGPVQTSGLAGTFSFTWKPERMAKVMVTKALKKKKQIQPQWFYNILTRMLRWAPAGWVSKLFEKV